jgi:hypothetical protein
MRDSFVFYASFYEAISNLPGETQLEVYNALCKYALLGELPELSPIAKAMFTVMRPVMDAASARYEASVANGKKGGRPKKENLEKPSDNLKGLETENLEKPSRNLNVNVNDNDNVNVNDNDKVTEIRAAKPPRTRFTPPSIDEVRAYCQERGNGVDAERFEDYYNANGWRVGKNAMKDWKAAVRTWEKNGYGNGGNNGNKKPVPMGATGELGAAELEAIRRVLGE